MYLEDWERLSPADNPNREQVRCDVERGCYFFHGTIISLLDDNRAYVQLDPGISTQKPDTTGLVIMTFPARAREYTVA